VSRRPIAVPALFWQILPPPPGPTGTAVVGLRSRAGEAPSRARARATARQSVGEGDGEGDGAAGRGQSGERGSPAQVKRRRATLFKFKLRAWLLGYRLVGKTLLLKNLTPCVRTARNGRKARADAREWGSKARAPVGGNGNGRLKNAGKKRRAENTPRPPLGRVVVVVGLALVFDGVELLRVGLRADAAVKAAAQVARLLVARQRGLAAEAHAAGRAAPRLRVLHNAVLHA
jgi:hypothetical protein